MRTFTAKEAKTHFGELLEAARHAPVEITFHGKPHVRIVSCEGLRHKELDRKKHELACKVLERHPLEEIRKRSLENIARWESNGVTPLVYKEWAFLLRNGSDHELIAAMVGLSDESNRLRQSPPYVGMLKEIA